MSETDFIAYDERFFDLVGPGARIEQVQELAPGQYHEASCFNPDTKELFFTELGGPSGISGDGFSGAHAWQYLLDTETNELRNITTSPPTFNVHGCVFYNGSYHVVTDGSPSGTATLARIDPVTLERTTLLNNYYQQPFISFNDLDIDPDGNFWLADSISGWVRRRSGRGGVSTEIPLLFSSLLSRLALIVVTEQRRLPKEVLSPDQPDYLLCQRGNNAPESGRSTPARLKRQRGRRLPQDRWVVGPERLHRADGAEPGAEQDLGPLHAASVQPEGHACF